MNTDNTQQQDLQKSKVINKIIQSKVSLAPMAGITDYVLRSLVREHSKNCILTTEMISSEALNQVPEVEILKRNEDHSPIIYQLSGHKPNLMAKAAKMLEGMADVVDINMGCPVRKVVGGNDGSALMRTPERATELVRAIDEAVSLPVSVKFRLGYTADEMNYVKFGQQMQEAGAKFITIHARTRAQMYGGKADWPKIKRLKENVDVPVFANGDITTIEKAEECMELSGADGVAIGRGILGDTTLIHRIEHFFATGERLAPPTLQERISTLKRHLIQEIELRGEDVGIKFSRKFYPYYINSIQGAAKYRAELVQSNSIDEIFNILNTISIARSEDLY